ncbi:MAG: hypothetical protein GC150_08105 [Rhizobiales bacterium]|nr:hypothetical protein [Hyphomicrobiales bacterium]
MTATVKRKVRSFVAEPPSGGDGGSDEWRDFRSVELIDMPLEFRFNHSLGKLSRFFLELEQRRLMATRCPACGNTWMPPRTVCPQDWSVTNWVELPGRGVLEAAVRSAYTATTDGGTDDLVLGYVRLEGAATSLLQRIRNYGDPARLVHGLDLEVVWAEGEVGHPMELFWFEPAR